MINTSSVEELFLNFNKNKPFSHSFIDNFLDVDLIKEIEYEFLDYNSSEWFTYKNQIEDKKAQNNWNIFPPKTYKLFQYMNSTYFVDILSKYVGVQLYADHGLHGGGYHIHSAGGILNPHLDYSIHPKLDLQRKLNLVIYVSKELEESHGGHLGLWSNNKNTNQPEELICEIAPKYNRAVIFDTTQNSWHGLSRPLTQPEGIYRKSLAVYYLCKPQDNAPRNQRAIYAPTQEQKNDPVVENIIQLRSDVRSSHKVYRI